jgi:hypothetical protein
VQKVFEEIKGKPNFQSKRVVKAGKHQLREVEACGKGFIPMTRAGRVHKNCVIR